METTTLTAVNDGIRAAIEAGRQLAETAKPFEINGTPMLVIPEGYKLEALEDHREKPLLTNQNTTHTTAESFIAYFNRFANNNSVIFIDKDKATFKAVIDYHSYNEPDNTDHTSLFALKKTPEWDNWLNNNKKTMNQEDFGRFIEDNLEEIIEPTGATMLEIALSIQAKTDTKFTSSQRLDNGQIQLQYHEEINGTAGTKGELKIPQTFIIGLKLFEGGEPYRIEARLRYRIKEGNLALWYELIRPHKTVDANIKDTTTLIADSILSGHIYYGTDR